MKTSVVIVNYNSGRFLENCLRSLEGENVEIVVVDNNSQDGSIERAREKFPKIRYILNSQNLGFARACNIGARDVRSDFILFLNPDTEVLPGAIRGAEDFMLRNRKCGILGGRVLNPDGSTQFTLRRFPSYINIFFGRDSPLRRAFPKNPFSKHYLYLDLDYSKPHKVDMVCGAFMFVRREVFEELSGFDEGFFLFVEDTDLCYRAKEKGWEVWYFPQKVCIHYQNEHPKGRGERFFHSMGMYRFFKKHYAPPKTFDFLLRFGLSILASLSAIGIKHPIDTRKYQ